jgi:bis(5'-nucleosidyl)-tetraphosphatase
MKKERSAGAIIYYRKNGDPRYLLLHYPFSGKSAKEYWDLPKGHVEIGESEKDTVQREVQEETGLRDIEFVDGFREKVHYWFQWEGEKISKTVVFFLAETKQDAIVISEEHLGFQWLPYEKALDQLTYENARGILKKAHHLLSAKSV